MGQNPPGTAELPEQCCSQILKCWWEAQADRSLPGLFPVSPLSGHKGTWFWRGVLCSTLCKDHCPKRGPTPRWPHGIFFCSRKRGSTICLCSLALAGCRQASCQFTAFLLPWLRAALASPGTLHPLWLLLPTHHPHRCLWKLHVWTRFRSSIRDPQ